VNPSGTSAVRLYLKNLENGVYREVSLEVTLSMICDGRYAETSPPKVAISFTREEERNECAGAVDIKSVSTPLSWRLICDI
jgi:hypothetical protein